MSKTKRPRSQKEITHDQIQALLTKLKEIVPNMPRNRKLSKLEIIQYVIDYIVDLQIALESHPVSHRGMNPRTGGSSNRQPLGVISSPSNSAANKCVVQEAECSLISKKK
ncbi:DNA-binding protein inhibitor ID-2 like protein [Argiope bruennichi]|uniref:DNA-binding protein inhibitor ID-2 like protein n=1 Tax=Argiope bruennichi TaxID=94029 RepID=A0A8T0F5R4_ARGBR|nr:DNA-binding protein inhibitor ID-2 like protein [Argiope bruennichi]